MGNRKTSGKPGKTDFEALLQRISPDEYREFMRHYAAKKEDFRTEVELYFAGRHDGTDISGKYDELVRKLIAKHSERGFISYRAASELERDVDRLLDAGRTFVAEANYRDAFALAKPVLRAMIEVQSTGDDSSGSLGGAVMKAMEVIETIADAPEAAPALKEEMFAFLEQELSDYTYFNNGDFGYELFGIYRSLALQSGKTEAFEQFVDARLAKLTGQFDAYDREFYLDHRISFAEATGRSKEAAKVIRQHLDIVSVRQGEVDKALENRDFGAAKALIADGIRVAEARNHPGDAAHWQKELLRVAVLENDTETIRHYAQMLAFAHGFDASYYDQWKKTYPPDEWKTTIEQYLAGKIAGLTKPLGKKRGAARNVPSPNLLAALAPVYIAEGYWDRLMALVKQENSLETALRYHPYLCKQYPGELLEIYLPALRRQGEQASYRPGFARLADTMKKIMADIPQGKVPLKDLAREIIAKHPTRSAYLEDLNAVLQIP